jgi:superfamily II DNA or RNA helicase
MDVKDFLTTYPTLHIYTHRQRPLHYPNFDSSFENKIFHLKEFNKERLTYETNTTEDRWRHQKVMARFLSPHTPYTSLLLVHEVGTGKTCAAFAIAEANKGSMRKTIFLSPSQDLNRQHKRELVTKCFPGEYPAQRARVLDSKNIYNSHLPYYTFTTPQTLGNIVKNVSSEEIQKQYSNTVFIIDEVHKIKPRENIKDKLKQIKKFSKQLPTMPSTTKAEQNAIYAVKKKIEDLKKKTVQTYTQLQRIFSIARNIKIVLLTGTPMIDRASEIVGVLNLILPSQKKLRPLDWKNESKLIAAMRNRVSFLKAPETSDPKVFEKAFYSSFDKSDKVPAALKTYVNSININIITSININVITCIMSDIQTKEYLKSWCGSIFKSIKGQWEPDVPDLCKTVKPPKQHMPLPHASEQISLLLIGKNNGSMPTLEGPNLFGDKIKYSKGSSKEVSSFFSTIGREVRKAGGPVSEFSNNFAKKLYPFAPKYAMTVKRLAQAYVAKKKVFIYIRPVAGSGANALRLLMMALGYIDVTYSGKRSGAVGGIKIKRKPRTALPSNPGKRFIFLTGNTTVDKAAVINIFNDPRNAQGEYIQVVIGTDTITQGFSIKDVQELHVHHPPWNYSTMEQAIGRIVRGDSHDAINAILEAKGAKKAAVQIYLYAAAPNMESAVGKAFKKSQEAMYSKNAPGEENPLTYWNSIDLKKYSRMSRKDREIKKVERLLRENAFDCSLFYNRNASRTSSDGSRNCEYDTCAYTCNGIPMNEIEEDETTDLIDVNYNILYSGNDVRQIKERLIYEYFPLEENSLISFNKIQRLFSSDNFSELVMIKALNEIIEEDGILRDKFNIPLFLREKNNMYYTTRIQDLEFPGNFNRVLLTQHATSEYTDEVSNSITINILCSQPLVGKKISNLMNVETPLIQELIMEHSVVALEELEDEENKVATAVINSPTVERALIQNNSTTTSTLMESCVRTITIPLQLSKKESTVFCGKTVPWAPPYWQDGSGSTSGSNIGGGLKNLVRSALAKKALFIGVGHLPDFFIMDIRKLYPLSANGSRNVNGKPSTDNLKRKVDGVSIDTRNVTSGRQVSSTSAAKLHSLLAEINSDDKTIKSGSDLALLLETSLRGMGLWIEKTTSKLSGSAMIKIYQELLN